jgi:hypothetical protein
MRERDRGERVFGVDAIGPGGHDRARVGSQLGDARQCTPRAPVGAIGRSAEVRLDTATRSERWARRAGRRAPWARRSAGSG